MRHPKMQCGGAPEINDEFFWPNFGIMDIYTKLKLFDSIIKPILLYGCEILGFENTIRLLKRCKFVSISQYWA